MCNCACHTDELCWDGGNRRHASRESDCWPALTEMRGALCHWVNCTQPLAQKPCTLPGLCSALSMTRRVRKNQTMSRGFYSASFPQGPGPGPVRPCPVSGAGVWPSKQVAFTPAYLSHTNNSLLLWKSSLLFVPSLYPSWVLVFIICCRSAPSLGSLQTWSRALPGRWCSLRARALWDPLEAP